MLRIIGAASGRIFAPGEEDGPEWWLCSAILRRFISRGEIRPLPLPHESRSLYWRCSSLIGPTLNLWGCGVTCCSAIGRSSPVVGTCPLPFTLIGPCRKDIAREALLPPRPRIRHSCGRKSQCGSWVISLEHSEGARHTIIAQSGEVTAVGKLLQDGNLRPGIRRQCPAAWLAWAPSGLIKRISAPFGSLSSVGYHQLESSSLDGPRNSWADSLFLE